MHAIGPHDPQNASLQVCALPSVRANRKRSSHFARKKRQTDARFTIEIISRLIGLSCLCPEKGSFLAASSDSDTMANTNGPPTEESLLLAFQRHPNSAAGAPFPSTIASTICQSVATIAIGRMNNSPRFAVCARVASTPFVVSPPTSLTRTSVRTASTTASTH